MANAITSFRFALLLMLVAMAYSAPAQWQLLNPLLMILIIILDGVDGYVARKRGETTLFGSVYDIMVDRIVENVLWIVLADLNLIPIWVALVFVIRSLAVDAIRGQSIKQGVTPFSMMRTNWGQFLVASRFMRGFYGTIKAVTFSWILLMQPMPRLFSGFWMSWSEPIEVVTGILVLTTIILCIVRGLPVLIEFYTQGTQQSKSEILHGPPS